MSNVEQARETVARIQEKIVKLKSHLASTIEALETAEQELEAAHDDEPADGEQVEVQAGHASGTVGAKT